MYLDLDERCERVLGDWKKRARWTTYDGEETTVDTADTFLSDDGHRAVHETAVLWLWPFGVVNKLRSEREAHRE